MNNNNVATLVLACIFTALFTLTGCVTKRVCKNTCEGKQYKSTFYFENAKADLDLETKEEIKQLAQNMGCGGFRVRLEGHADISGFTAKNMSLGEQRTQAVKDFILSLGVPADKIDVISYGDTHPAEDDYTPEAYSKNRRVEVVFIYDGGQEVTYSSPDDIYVYDDKVQDDYADPRTAVRAKKLLEAAQKANAAQKTNATQGVK